MNSAQIVLLVVTGLALLQLLRGRWRMDVAGLFLLVALGLAQYLGLPIVSRATGRDGLQAVLRGFSQPMIFTLIGLFILTQTLQQQGVLDWLAARVTRAAGGSVFRLTLVFSALAVFLSLFMNNIAVGALLLPVALQSARRANVSAGKLLLPIAFATSLGGMSTYFTTANIVMSELLASAHPPQAPLGVLAFTPTGGLIAAFGLVYLAVAAPRLLPERHPAEAQRLAHITAETLAERFHLDDRLWEVQVLPHSPLAGETLRETQLGAGLGVSVVAIWRGRQALLRVDGDTRLQPHDILLLIGNASRLQQIADWGCRIGRSEHFPSENSLVLTEIMPSPHAAHVLGHTLRELNFRRRYGFTVVALLRKNISYRTDVGNFRLQIGDTLLAIGPRQALEELHASEDWIVLNEVCSAAGQLTWRSWASLGLFVGLVALSLLGLPVHLAALLMALAALLGGLIAWEKLYRAIDWRVIFFLSGMYAVGQGMVHTGLVARAGNLLTAWLPHPSLLQLAALSFWGAALLTQFMGSQATAFVVGPVVIAAAVQTGVAAQPVALAAAIGCSASFLTPLSHPVNLIMVTPGRYHFADFPRLGIGLLFLTFGALLLGLRLFWGA